MSDVVEFVACRYPARTDARFFKRAVFGQPGRVVLKLLPQASERDILQALGTSASASSFDANELALDNRARELWSTDRNECLRLVDHLVHNDHNVVGESLLFSLARSLDADDAAKIVDVVPALAATVVRLNPQAAVSPNLWRGPDDRQWTLFDAATSEREIPADTRRGIVEAMLSAGSDAVAESVGRKFGPEAIFAVLDWFDGGDFCAIDQIARRWLCVLGSRQGSAIDWLAAQESPREVTVALIAGITSPHDQEVHQRGPLPWLKPYRDPAVLDRSAALRLRAFLLALGFDNTGPASDELVVESFATVHEGLAKDWLSYDAWSWLEDQIPTLSWLRNWDRCERLRRGLTEQFVEHRWPAAKFVQCAASEEMLESMLESCRKSESGKILLHRLETALSAGDLIIDSGRRRTLKRYL